MTYHLKDKVFNFELVSVIKSSHDHRSMVVDGRLTHIINDDLHLQHVIAGKGYLIHEDVTHDIQKGKTIFIEPHHRFGFETDPGEELHFLNFHFHLRNGLGLSLHHLKKLPLIFDVSDVEKSHVIMRKSYDDFQHDDPLRQIRVNQRLMQLALKYFETYSKDTDNQSPSDESMLSLRQYLEAPSTREFSSEEISQRFSLSQSQINRRFKQSFGNSPKAFWQNNRLKNIQEELLSGRFTIGELAERYGFQNPYYFSNWFKTKVGASPSAFRKNLLENTSGPPWAKY